MTVDVANKLMSMRKEHGLSQEELADKLGVSRQSVGKWERAESSPDTDNLILLAQLYGVSIDNLLGTSPSGGEATVGRADSTTKREGRGISFSYSLFGKDDSNNKSKADGIVACLALLAYLVLGVLGYWHPAWIIFVAIPVLQFVVNAIACRYSVAKVFASFPFAVLVTVAYLLLGFITGGWGIWWVLYIAVPLYHSITLLLCRKKAVIDYHRYDKDGNEVASYHGSPDEIAEQGQPLDFDGE